MKITAIFFILTIFFLTFSACDKSEKVKREKFDKLLGSYMLDVKRTDLGTYSPDSLYYKDLNIKFLSDSTFRMNKSVPFIFDSIGIWETGGNSIDDINNIYYKRKVGIKTQFTILYFDSGDSIFYMNSVTPREKQKPIHKIFFKKSR